MKGFFRFLKTTIVGGVLYLVPIIVLAAVIGKALEISHKVVAPLAAKIPAESLIGIRTPLLLAIALMVLFCFLAGLFAKTNPAKKIGNWLEMTILSNLPGYEFIKNMSEDIAGVEKEQGNNVVLARIEDAWQVALLIERIEGGHAAVFVPGAPNPRSGSVYFMSEDRIRPLNLPLPQVLKCLRRIGKGSNELLRGRL